MGVKEVKLEELRVGDAIRVHWLDASEKTRSFSRDEKSFDMPIWTYGAYLGVKGHLTKHIVIAKEIIVREKTFHYNVIPVGMIQTIYLLSPSDLPAHLLNSINRKIAVTPLKRFNKGVKGGWKSFEFEELDKESADET